MSDNTEPTTALVVDKGTALPAFSGQEMAAAFTAYRALQDQLDLAMPNEIMTIGKRQFRKKGYWRAIRMAFNLSVECIKEERVDIYYATTGETDWGWLVTYRAKAGNGRTADGDGACYSAEKQKKVGDTFATEHNVRSHAHTRAFNRAVSNLVGFGEVSADELSEDDASRIREEGGHSGEHHAPRPQQRERSAPAQQGQRQGPRGKLISDPMRGRFFAKWKAAGKTQEEVDAYLMERFGIESSKELTFDVYDAACAWADSKPVESAG